jgi:hypothetical protein
MTLSLICGNIFKTGKYGGSISLLKEHLAKESTSQEESYKIATYLIRDAEDAANLQSIANALAIKITKVTSEPYSSGIQAANEYVMSELMLENRLYLAESFFTYARDTGTLNPSLVSDMARIHATNGDFPKAIELLSSFPNQTDDLQAQLASYYFDIGELTKAVELANALRQRNSPVESSLTNIPFELS